MCRITLQWICGAVRALKNDLRSSALLRCQNRIVLRLKIDRDQPRE